MQGLNQQDASDVIFKKARLYLKTLEIEICLHCNFIAIYKVVKLNRLRTGVGRFHSSMHKWGLAPSPNYECGASEQTADHVLTACPIHRAPHGVRGLTVLNDETRCWLNDTTASI